MNNNLNKISTEERSNTISKMMFLIAHLDICVDLIDELEPNEFIWRHKLKQTGKPFLSSALSATKEVLQQFSGEEKLVDEFGNVITDEHVQLQAWELIKQVKDLNNIAIENLKKIKYD